MPGPYQLVDYTAKNNVAFSDPVQITDEDDVEINVSAYEFKFTVRDEVGGTALVTLTEVSANDLVDREGGGFDTPTITSATMATLTPGAFPYDWLWKGAATGNDWQTLQEGRFIVEQGVSS
jgi:hypothetical protein